ncbi:TldD/PmbA family protein [Dubosiella newyorkensis]|uniref:TldD/PmbA family protein n=1 Tax=Dubosiella newyorkensis TaxID=1862672 RepID=UPI00248B405C|nr:TldD/PmbA family protein [Dubosiella newyorkensis]
MNKQAWIEKAKELGLESFEIYQSLSASKEMTWYEHAMDTFVTSKILGTSLRGIVDGNVAMIALEQVDDSKMDSVLKQLVDQAKTIQTPEKVVFATPKPLEEKAVSSRQWVQPSMQQVEKTMAKIEEKCLAYDPRIVQVGYLGYEEGKGAREITNSLGLHLEDEDQVQYLVCSIVALENGVYKDATKVEVVENFDTFDIDAFVKEVCQEALDQLGARSIPSTTCPIILEKDAMSSLFGAFAGLFSGDLIAKGISPIAKDLGKKIFSEQVSVIDDPRDPNALSIANFDDEGVLTKRKVLVDHGVFEQALYDIKSAIKMNTESTGNGFKSGYASPVSVQSMNLSIVPGEKDLDGLMEQMQNGLVITDLMGLHAGIHFVSTQFSLQASGYRVKDGKRSEPVTLITIAGTFLDLMNHVVAIGNDMDWSYKQVVCPSVLFEKCAVSGE